MNIKNIKIVALFLAVTAMTSCAPKVNETGYVITKNYTCPSSTVSAECPITIDVWYPTVKVENACIFSYTLTGVDHAVGSQLAKDMEFNSPEVKCLRDNR